MLKQRRLRSHIIILPRIDMNISLVSHHTLGYNIGSFHNFLSVVTSSTILRDKWMWGIRRVSTVGMSLGPPVGCQWEIEM